MSSKPHIDWDNYQLWFLDFHEGALRDEEREAVCSFVESHPELREEFESYSQEISLPKLDIIFQGKNRLMKSVYSEDELAQMMIGYLEGDLSDNDRLVMNRILEERPEVYKQFEAYRRTILTPIVVNYPFKESLKREQKIVRWRSAVWLSVAATLILLFLFRKAIIQKNTPVENHVLTTHTTGVKERTFTVIESSLPEADSMVEVTSTFVAPIHAEKIQRVESVPVAETDEYKSVHLDTLMLFATEELRAAEPVDTLLDTEKWQVVSEALITETDIFSKQDLLELEELPATTNSHKSHSHFLKRLSEGFGIHFKRRTNNETQEVVYTFGIGRYSLSTTQAKR